MEHKSKIRSFTDLDAWKEGHKLGLMIYGITRRFPKDELFGLTSQIRRCSVSVTSNIDEGFSRQSYKEKAEKSIKVHKIINGLIKNSRGNYS